MMMNYVEEDVEIMVLHSIERVEIIVAHAKIVAHAEIVAHCRGGSKQ